MKFFFLSRKAVEALDPLGEPHLFISVTTPGDPNGLAVLPENEKTLGTLRLAFHEAYAEWESLRVGYSGWLREREADGTAFTRETGKSVLSFVRSHPGAEVIVVHCDGGLARSPAIVRALADTVFVGQETEGVPEADYRLWPTCYRHIIEAWV